MRTKLSKLTKQQLIDIICECCDLSLTNKISVELELDKHKKPFNEKAFNEYYNWLGEMKVKYNGGKITGAEDIEYGNKLRKRCK